MRILYRAGLLALMLTMMVGLALAAAQDEKRTELNLGDRAPAFESKDGAGLTWKSADHREVGEAT